MSEPLVCAILLTKDRPTMAARAVRSFNKQTYKNCGMVIIDTSYIESDIPGAERMVCVRTPFAKSQETIGALRNRAIKTLTIGADIIVHFDDDDWSHPRRIEEQVALLVASGKECVGYNEMLFWQTLESVADTASERAYRETVGPVRDEAWLFQNKSPNYALGTSLCYWRKTWEKHPFPDKMRGEDYDFVYGCDSAGCTSMPTDSARMIEDEDHPWVKQSLEPRMIASIHAGNGVRVDQRAPHHWTRVPNFDAYCRSVMSL